MSAFCYIQHQIDQRLNQEAEFDEREAKLAAFVTDGLADKMAENTIGGWLVSEAVDQDNDKINTCYRQYLECLQNSGKSEALNFAIENLGRAVAESVDEYNENISREALTADFNKEICK